MRRSRKGAWIEILADQTYADECDSRSRKGAWIEMQSCYATAQKS